MSLQKYLALSGLAPKRREIRRRNAVDKKIIFLRALRLRSDDERILAQREYLSQ